MVEKGKLCGHCGEPLAGRADKRFCSDQCRARSGNKRKLEDRGERLIREVNNALRRNRLILQRFSPEGKTTLRREALLQAGFDFRYFTHLYRTQKGSTYHFCYDYGYLLLPEEKMLIVNHQAYMDR
ncbi:hypothetical protein [Rufibacter hautae]|uniref:DUF2116 family Zn-ribbon domain-containing protein n=1 Tax=Rufibacter hautae TaxID=2595005 RepID=A0A5B6TEG5_9BACT|nr:hypothetical protein [Rufibacter hautae]KAA3438857.1 hypothetical protein FOA19_11655 [Rufibacter hautae]